jgi:hypothetical protein
MRWTKVIGSVTLSGVCAVAMLTGANSLNGQSKETQLKRETLSKVTAAFTARLEQRIARNDELQQALDSTVECLDEITALIIADLVLQQAQHDRDVADQALEKCIMSAQEPDPNPVPNPTPEPVPEVPPNGEFSVLAR